MISHSSKSPTYLLYNCLLYPSDGAQFYSLPFIPLAHSPPFFLETPPPLSLKHSIMPLAFFVLITSLLAMETSMETLRNGHVASSALIFYLCKQLKEQLRSKNNLIMLYVALVLRSSRSELSLYRDTSINIIKPQKFPLNIFLCGEMRKILF